MSKSEINLEDTAIAFKSKSNNELQFSYWLFRFMGSNWLVNVFSKLTVWAIRMNLPVTGLIKSTIFNQFCGGESIDESKKVIDKLYQSGVYTILDYSVEGKGTEENFDRTKDEILRIIRTARDSKAIPYTSVKITGIASSEVLAKMNAGELLNATEEQQYQNIRKRLIEIARLAKVNKVPVYYDAEESWIQDAIDHLAEEMMQEFNQERTVVLTTLQMYRHDRIAYLENLIKKAKEEKFFVGIKLVRGAYMEKENLRASEKGYPTPIQPSKAATDNDFDRAVSICLDNIDIVTLCAGTHNEASTMHLIQGMKARGLANDHPNIYFSQLFGMSDHITFNLADAGYNVTKYLPYGPVKSVIPYLIRRAHENSAISGQMGRELKLIIEEKQRRKTQ